MASSHRFLQPHQVEVLQWIADGCQPGAVSGTTYKHSAAALQRRNLVKISRKRGTWSASITDDGKYVLEHRHPVGKPWIGRLTGPPQASSGSDRVLGQPGKHPVEALVDEVVAAGGELRVNTKEDDRQLANLVRAANRFGKAPDGKVMLIERGDNWSEKLIRLVETPPVVPADITIPDTLRTPHPIVARLREKDSDARFVTQPARARALRLTHALLTEADARGYATHFGDLTNHHGRRMDTPWFSITIDGHSFGVVIKQLQDRTRHEPTAQELRRREKYEWARIPQFDEKPGLRLSMRITNGWERQRSTWKDGKTPALERSLAEVLREIELRAVAAKKRAQERLREEEEQRLRLLEERARAEEKLQEQHRSDSLHRAAQRWEEVKLLRAYLVELQAKVKAMPAGDAKAEAETWLRWCDEHVARVDPMNKPVRSPTPLEATAERLKPFMPSRWPWGP